MQHIKHYFLLAILALAFVACSEDDGTSGPTSFVTDLTSIDFQDGDTVMVEYSATSGEAELTSLSILEDGSRIDQSNLIINGVQASANPILLFNEDRTTFTYQIGIISDFSTDISKTYSFNTTDAANDVTSQTLTISVDTSGTGGGGGGGDDTPPVITVDTAIDRGNFVQLNFDAAIGSGQLVTMAAYRDGALMSTDELDFNGVRWAANPVDLPSDFANGILNADLNFNLHDAGESEYLFVLTDENDLSDSVVLLIEVAPQIVETAVLLLNQSGPSGQGSVNLITGGMGNGNDANSHLRDLGIDVNEPASTNWRQQIAPGALAAGLKDVTGLADFASVTTQEEIQTIYNDDAGTDIGAEGSDVIQVGDVFALLSTNNEYVLFRIDAVTVRPDMGDNSDFYNISVKF